MPATALFPSLHKTHSDDQFCACSRIYFWFGSARHKFPKRLMDSTSRLFSCSSSQICTRTGALTKNQRSSAHFHLAFISDALCAFCVFQINCTQSHRHSPHTHVRISFCESLAHDKQPPETTFQQRLPTESADSYTYFFFFYASLPNHQ